MGIRFTEAKTVMDGASFSHYCNGTTSHIIQEEYIGPPSHWSICIQSDHGDVKPLLSPWSDSYVCV